MELTDTGTRRGLPGACSPWASLRLLPIWDSHPTRHPRPVSSTLGLVGTLQSWLGFLSQAESNTALLPQGSSWAPRDPSPLQSGTHLDQGQKREGGQWTVHQNGG